MSAQLESQAISIDAPIEGWDAYHSLDNMPQTAAIVLDNLIPEPGKVRTREGYIEYANLEIAAPVQTVASVDNEESSVLLAMAGGGVWQISNTTPGGGSSIISQISAPGTFTSDKWQTENFRKADESGIMVMCNGVDPAQVVYEDVVPGTWLIRDLIDTNTVGTEFIGCVAFKGRMYYWKDNDNAFYYSQAGAYEGELQKFDLGTFNQKGGKLVFVGTWTQQDSGDGKDDFIYFMFSTGEILLYQGDDPETIGYWEMVGRYFTAEPLSIRGVANYGADTIIMTKDGYVALSTIIQQGRISDVPAFSRLIHNAIKQRTNRFSSFYGWDVELFQKKGLMIFNVPIGETVFEQHVLNTVTQRWCRFNSLNVNCVEVHDERLFGGGEDGRVYALLEGETDNGEAIYFDCLYAFQYFGDPGRQKHMVAAQIISTHRNPEFVILRGYSDFEVPVLGSVQIPLGRQQAVWSINPATPPQAVGSFWDQDYWDAQDTPYTTKGWQNISAYGYAVSLLVRFALRQNTVDWRSTNLRFLVGGAH
jgi:hypothetical protein